MQVAAWPDGTLADVSTPVPGRRHDSAALRLVGWADQIADAPSPVRVELMASSEQPTGST